MTKVGAKRGPWRAVSVPMGKLADRFRHDPSTPGFLLSAGFHALLLIILALSVLPTVIGQQAIYLTDGGVPQQESPEILELNALEPEPLVVEPPPVLQVVPLAFSDAIDSPVELGVEPAEVESVESLGPVGEPTPSDSASVASEATSVESAVDTVTDRILRQLERGDLLVVWLLDASHSLVDDRRRVADQLEPFLSEIAARPNVQGHQLTNAVVAFGKTIKERVPPTRRVREVIRAVEKLPIDRSGRENVFAAIAKCAERYRESRNRQADREQLMVVVWTDETGDDGQLVEETIEVCRQNQTTVCVVGPSSVLGAETGLHSYYDPKTKATFQLPIKRGPDSALPERLELGYWFRTRGPGRNRVRGRGRSLPAWYGGRHLQGMASGFSPHALTRLVAHTGGTYTVFDRPEDRGPFRTADMRPYAPEYLSTEEYLISVSSQPLRRAVHQAVQVTQGKKLLPPEFMLFVKRDDQRPDLFERPYLTPAVFAQRLRARRRALQRAANRQTTVIEEALRHLSSDGEVDGNLESEYAQETSPRWRAWYDLTRGRLLATTIRLEEYRLVLDELTSGGLRGSTNHVILFPAQELRSSLQARAEEAERPLRRCVEEHPNTPWALLAERELAYGLGIFPRQMALDAVPVGPATPRAVLPNL